MILLLSLLSLRLLEHHRTRREVAHQLKHFDTADVDEQKPVATICYNTKCWEGVTGVRTF